MFRATMLAATLAAALVQFRAVEAAPPAFLSHRAVRAEPAGGAGTIIFPTSLNYYDYITSAAFTPDGNAYFNLHTGTPGPYLRFSPDGTFTILTVPFVGGDRIIYAHDFLWSGSYDGIVEFSPDGTKYRDYYLGAPIQSGLADGPNGSVYATSIKYDSTTKVYENLFFQVGGAGGIKRLMLPVRPLGPLAMGADTKAWFSYEDDATSTFGIARVEPNGSVTLFPVTGEGVGLQPPYYSMIEDRGALYFTFVTAPPNVHEVFGKITVDGTITEMQFPFQTSAPLALSADKGGNIWMSLSSPLGANYNNGIFEYDIYNGQFSGPYFEAGPDNVIGPGPYVGLDNNVYFFNDDFANYTISLAVYTRQLQTLEPRSVVLTPGKTTPIAILETHANGPWTARSLNPVVAIVSSASSKTGGFNLVGRASGTTTIAVADRLGNTVYETVTTR